MFTWRYLKKVVLSCCFAALNITTVVATPREFVLTTEKMQIDHISAVWVEDLKKFYRWFNAKTLNTDPDRHDLINLMTVLLFKHRLIPARLGSFVPAYFRSSRKREQSLYVPKLQRSVALEENGQRLVINIHSEKSELFGYTSLGNFDPASCLAKITKSVGSFKIEKLQISLWVVNQRFVAQAEYKCTVEIDKPYYNSLAQWAEGEKKNDKLDDRLLALLKDFVVTITRFEKKWNDCKVMRGKYQLENLPWILDPWHGFATGALFVHSVRFLTGVVLRLVADEIIRFAQSNKNYLLELSSKMYPHDFISLEISLSDSFKEENVGYDTRVWFFRMKFMPKIFITFYGTKNTSLVADIELAARAPKTKTNKSGGKVIIPLIRYHINFGRLRPNKEPSCHAFLAPFFTYKYRLVLARIAQMFLYKAHLYKQKMGNDNTDLYRMLTRGHATLSGEEKGKKNSDRFPSYSFITGSFGYFLSQIRSQLERLITGGCMVNKKKHWDSNGVQRMGLTLGVKHDTLNCTIKDVSTHNEQTAQIHKSKYKKMHRSRRSLRARFGIHTWQKTIYDRQFSGNWWQANL